MILVSACLLDKKTKYNGGSNPHPLIMQYAHAKECLVVCPETMGNLKIPRPPAEIVGGSGQDVLRGCGKVCNELGQDITAHFIYGANQTLKLALSKNIAVAILKERSPSCGSHAIYDGTFSRKTKQGQGVTAALLMQHGITVYSEEQMTPGLITQLFGNRFTSS